MAGFSVNILGCGSATPTSRHNPSSQVVDFRDKLFMIDCGEGAQVNMRRMGLKFSRLNNIFISHLHGDHCFGLPGLLSTMALYDKRGTVTLHISEEGREVFEPMLRYFLGECPFSLQFNIIPVNEHKVIYEDSSLIVETFPLYHRVPANGFIFREKPGLRHLDGAAAKFYGVPLADIKAVKEGKPWTAPDGRIIPNELLTTPPSPVASYAYCSDTVYDRRVSAFIKGVDVVYHEATYGDDNAFLAKERGHSTARQAARIARGAHARHLILGHYSMRYIDEEPLRAQALEEFPSVSLANELMKFNIHSLATGADR